MRKTIVHSILLLVVLAAGLNDNIHANGPIVSNPLERSLAYKGHLYINQGKNLVVVEQDDPTKVRCVFGLSDYLNQIAFNNSTTSLYGGSPPTAGPDYLFAVLHSGEVEIIDISDPCNLQSAATIAAVSYNKAQYAMAAGDRLYVTGSRSYINWDLKVFDISNPAAPSFLGQTGLGDHYGSSLGGQIRALDINNIVYEIPGVLTQVQNVSDPCNMAHVFTFFTPANGGLITRDQELYLTNINDWITSLQIWDMSTPASPGLLGSIGNVANLLSYSSSITLMDKDGQNYLLIGATDMPHEWLVVIRVTDPSDPRIVSITRLQSATGDVVPYAIDIVGSEALISGWNMPFPGPGRKHRYRYYLVRMDMTDPTDPQWVNTVEIPSIFVKDASHKPLGSTLINADNLGNLVVTSMGISATSGARFDGTECTDTCDEVVGDFDCTGLDLTIEESGGQFSLLGLLNNPGVVSLAELSLNNNAGSLEVSVDYSALGSTSVDIEVYDNDAFVNSNDVVGGDVVGIISAADGPMPQVTGLTFGYLSATSSFVPIGLFGIIVHLDQTGRFTPTGGNSIDGDDIYLLADGASQTITGFSDFEIQATNIASFTINRMQWVYAPVCGDDSHSYSAADFDKNCRVTLTDLEFFASQWLQCNAPDCE